MVENMELAFIAWNRYPGSATGGQSLPDEPGWAEWLVRRPSVVGMVRPTNFKRQIYVRIIKKRRAGVDVTGSGWRDNRNESLLALRADGVL
jgi:hypothetical protein